MDIAAALLFLSILLGGIVLGDDLPPSETTEQVHGD